MAEQEEEKNLDLATQLVETYKKANIELMERVSIIKTSYSEAAKEHELIKQVQKETEKAIKSKKLLVLLEEEVTKGTVKSSDIEEERGKILDRIKNLTVDKSLAEKAANEAQKDGLKEQTELYQDIVKEIEESIDKLEKMEGAAKGVEDQAKKLEGGSGTSFFTALDEAFGTGGKGKASGFFQTLGEGFSDAAKAAKKIGFDQDQAKAAGVERKNIEKDDRMGANAKDPKQRGRFRDKTSGKLVGGDKVKALDSKIAKGGGGMIKRMGGAFKALIAKIGPMLKKMLGPLGIVLEVLDAIKKSDAQLVNMSKTLSMSKDEAVQLRNSMSSTALATGDVFVSTDKLIKAQNTLNKELGLAVHFNNQIGVFATQLLEKVKMTAAATAGLAGQALITGGSFRSIYGDALAISYEMSRAAKIPIDQNKIMEQVGKTTGVVRSQLGGSTVEITKAVTQATLLGMELNKVAAAGRQLLDFESSIAAEMEAELLTGKQLNLEKARLAALTGDYETLTKEIAVNMGDYTSFNAMNVLQQEALAKSLGMQASEVSDILFTQETQNKTKKELIAMGKKDLVQRMEQTTAQDKFNAAMDKLKGLIADIITPLMPLVDMIMSVLGPVFELLAFMEPTLRATQLQLTMIADTVKFVLGGFGLWGEGFSDAYSNTREAKAGLDTSIGNSAEMLGIENSFGKVETGYHKGGIANTPQIAMLAEKEPEVVLNKQNMNEMFNVDKLVQAFEKGNDRNTTVVAKVYKRPYSDANYYSGPAGREMSGTGIYT